MPVQRLGAGRSTAAPTPAYEAANAWGLDAEVEVVTARALLMFASAAFAALILAMAAVALSAILPRVAIWRGGRPAQVDWVRGLWAWPRRYLGDVHDIVAREPVTVQMHAWTAGGFMAGSAMALVGALPGLRESTSWWGLDELAFAVLLRGALVEARRRPSARLPGGRFPRLPALLLGYGLGGLGLAVCAMLRASPAATAAPLALAGVCGLTLAAYAGRGPMRHAVAGSLYLAAHPRPERFAGGRSVALQAGEGIKTPEDFAWNERLGFDACVQCGRCETACPAFAAGLPLNPRTFIQDLVAAPSRQPLIGGAVGAETLGACTTCRACVEECPMTIEHLDAIVGLRRGQPTKPAATPAGDFTPGLRVLGPGEAADVLLWFGPEARDPRGARTLAALARLLAAAGVDFATLGERDSGDGARRRGEEAAFARMARDNIAALAGVRFDNILTADPHALNALRNEYPALGGSYEVWHHTAFLDALVHDDKLILGRLDARATYHDPCYLARYNGETQAPRRLLDSLGLERVEMERHGMRSFCCGGATPGDGRIADLRKAQARDTGAALVAVACPNCALNLEDAGGLDVRDVAELALAAYEAASAPLRRDPLILS